ncbi:MAG: hypothetical protein RR234_05955 [Christensenella sp.]
MKRSLLILLVLVLSTGSLLGGCVTPKGDRIELHGEGESAYFEYGGSKYYPDLDTAWLPVRPLIEVGCLEKESVPIKVTRVEQYA